MAGTSVTRISSGDKPSSVLLIRYEHDFAVRYALEMPPVRTLAIAFRGLHELVASDPAVLVGDFLDNRDGQVLAAHHGAHELRRVEQRLDRAGVEPGVSPPQRHDVE